MDDRPVRMPQTAEVIQSPPRRQAKPADPCAMVIFGATGDLTKRLVIPALYNLSRTKVLPEHFALIGVARAEGTSESWRDQLYDTLKSFVGNATTEFDVDHIDEAAWMRLAEKMVYVRGDLNKPELYDKLRDALEEADKTRGTQGNAIFYLAVADRLFGSVVQELGNAKLTDQVEDENGNHRFWRRVVIEKPFGHSLNSACELNAHIQRSLHEDQIFRIDHFLGKDTVQSIMAFRFANGLFEPIWNRDRIDHVQITAAETVGVEQRGSFYEGTGALRDMVPNHLFTLLSMVAMEPPTGFDAAAIRSKKVEVFAAMPAVRLAAAVRGQYGAGTVLGENKKAYRQEPNVAPKSNTETYVAMRLEIDNWRWAGVPFYLRTGKHMSQRNTEIAIRFKQAPYAAFQDTPVDSLRPNWLVLRISPDEGISLQFEVKRRGPVVDLAAVKMDFHYDDWFPKEPNVGYETLIYDVMIGDPTLFMRADMVEQTWRIVQPVLDAWAKNGAADPPIYPAGSEGPTEADALLARDGRSWRSLHGDDDGGLVMSRARSQPFKCSAVISDVDGTLVTDDKVLTGRAQAAVAELRASGIIFSIISSRPPRGLRMLIERLGIVTPVGGFNGGVIATPDLAVVTEHLLSSQVARRAVDITECPRGRGLGFQRTKLAVARPRRALCPARAAHGGISADNSRRFWICPWMPPPRSSVSARISMLLEQCERDVRVALTSSAFVARSQAYYLDITHPLANKGVALTEIAKLLGIPLAEIAVIGDGGNDVAMFERSGLSIAMGNANPQVQRAADFVTDSNGDDGFANAIERFILGGGRSHAAVEPAKAGDRAW